MVIHLPQDIESALRAEVLCGHFSSTEEAVAEAVRYFLRERPSTLAAAKGQSTSARKPIWEVFENIAADIADEEWAKLPADGAQQHDHYIYGAPKRPGS